MISMTWLRLKRQITFLSFSFADQFPDILQEFSSLNFVTNRECNNVLSAIEYGVTPKHVCSIEPNAGTCWVGESWFCVY